MTPVAPKERTMMTAETRKPFSITEFLQSGREKRATQGDATGPKEHQWVCTFCGSGCDHEGPDWEWVGDHWEHLKCMNQPAPGFRSPARCYGEIDTDFTDHPVCPYCGNEMQDDWELGSGEDFEPSCGDCGREYVLSRYVSWSYTSKKTEARR